MVCLCVVFFLSFVAQRSVSILAFGAVPGVNTTEAAMRNGVAFYQAVATVNDQ